MDVRTFLSIIASLIFMNDAISQIPVEVFVGHKKASVDLMFFRYFKNHKDDNSKFLFFNRNRVSIDYKQTSTTYLPVFGFTEAVSYNHPKWRGFAPVAVVQINNRGLYPKAGIPFFGRKKEFTFFSWVVQQLLENSSIDLFVLTRFEPKLTAKLSLFTQLELVNALPFIRSGDYNLFQRIRVGLKVKNWQSGVGTDLNEFGNKSFVYASNIGGFLRHEF